MKKLILSLIVAVSATGLTNMNAMDSNSISTLEKSKQYLKYVKQVISNFEDEAQMIDTILTTGLVIGFGQLASGVAVPAGLVSLITVTGIGSVIMKSGAIIGKFSRDLTESHIWNMEHNQIQS